MRVLIAGIDGYLGWALAQHLAASGHTVGGVDLLLRRRWVEEMGSWSAIPIASIPDRLAAFHDKYNATVAFWESDLRAYASVVDVIRAFRPDAIVHLGECPSAPYSMIDVDHATFVQTNNIGTTFNLLFGIRECAPDAHLVKLGTMGEYGTPNVDIPEGFFEIEFRGRRDRLPFPRQAGSWYHWSKVHGSNNLMFASRLWGLRATDIMQGVVFGTRTDEIADEPALRTRLDFDQAFGTVINRFCCQAAAGHPLTLFGEGHQRRGFLPLRDAMQCIRLAIETPARRGEYRVLNQFQQVYSIDELARTVQTAAGRLGLGVDIRRLENPRQEAEHHHYCPDHQALFELGYRPTLDVEAEIRQMIADLQPFAGRILARHEALIPDIRWSGGRAKAAFLESPAAGSASTAGHAT
jgi:UDP-sulfoquinovose synthase